MILTVTLNSTIDKSYAVDNFRVDRIHQSQSFHIIPGGKGINIGRVFRELEGNVLLTGFAGGHNGEFIVKSTLAEGLVSDFIRINGESRTCIKIVDPINKTQTEINEVGPVVTPDEMERFLLKYESLVPSVDFITLSGSIPPGVPDDIYRNLVEIARKYDTKCLLDSSGIPLVEGIKGKPYIIKPNINELGQLIGKQLATLEEAIDAAKQLLTEGIEIIIVTFGKDGAIAVTNTGVLRSIPPTIKFMNAVGSGDAFAAGFVYSHINGNTLEEDLKYGTAAGAANASTLGSGLCTKDNIMSCIAQTDVIIIEGASEQ